MKYPPNFTICVWGRVKVFVGLWPNANTTFEESEVPVGSVLETRRIENAAWKIADLGCGWGSLTLHLAERFLIAKLPVFRQSIPQRDYILKTAAKRIPL
jgi:cyclopropane-fatty-acyl-phospholipid synthase